jgi:hypothetical protein
LGRAGGGAGQRKGATTRRSSGGLSKVGLLNEVDTELESEAPREEEAYGQGT